MPSYYNEKQISTTNGTQTLLDAFIVPTGCTLNIDCRVLASRKGGSAGSAGDSAKFKIEGAYKNIGGTVTIIKTLEVNNYQDSAWDATLVINGSTVELKVTGATNNNIDWFYRADIYYI